MEFNSGDSLNMDSQPKKKKLSYPVEVDRLSSLPDNVMEIILIRVPIKERGRTSILSKNWRYRWTLIPEIVISESELDGDYGFVEAVDTILALHDGPILKFYLDTYTDPEEDIKRWIQELSRKGIRELTLKVGLFIEENSDIFSCKNLNYLSLSGGDIQIPVKFHGFEFLNTLELLCVSFTEEDIEKLVSSCPLLKNLVLDTIYGYIALNIRALNLESLVIHGEFLDLELCSPKLCNLYLELGLGENEIDDFIVINLPRIFRGLPNLERLEMNSFMITHCSGPLQSTAPVILNCLKEVNLTLKFKDKADTAIALSLFATAPGQENTSITVRGKVTRWEATFSRDVLLKHLQDLKIEGSGPVNSCISLIKFILRSAPRLENLKFWTWQWPHGSEEVNPTRSFSEPQKLRVSYASRLC